LSSKLAAFRFAAAAALSRIAILAVAVLLAVLARILTGSAWAFLIVLAAGVFIGAPLVERLLRRRSISN
jgi:hypothetical protein